MHVKSILHEFGTCKIDFTYIRYYLAAKIDFTGFPILAAPDVTAKIEYCVKSILRTCLYIKSILHEIATM